MLIILKIYVIVGLVLATIGCSRFSSVKMGVVSQSSMTLQDLQIERVSLPESTNGPISLKGQCASKDGPVLLVMTDVVAKQEIACVAGKFLVALSLTGEDGLKTLQVSQTGRGGRVWADSVSVLKDTKSPVVSIVNIQLVAGSAGRSLQLNGTCESGLPVNLSGDILNAVSANCTNGLFQIVTSLTVGDGKKNLEVSQLDKAGNSGVFQKVYLSDSVAPAVTLTAPIVKSVVGSTATLQGVCEKGLDLKISGSGVASTIIDLCSAGTYSYLVQFTDGDGDKEVSVSQVDSSGNIGTWSGIFRKVTVVSGDSTPPVLTITSPLAGSSLTGVLQLQGSCETGLAVAISGSISTPLSVSCVSEKFSGSVTLAVGDGAKSVTVSQKDTAGNVGLSTRSFVLDTINPKISISSPAQGSAVRIKGTIVSGTCEPGITVVLYGSGVATNVAASCTSGTFSGQVDLTSGDGLKDVRAGQTDLAGNFGVSITSVTLDTQPPVLTLLSPAEGTLAETGVTLSGKCEDGFAVTASGTGVASLVQTSCAGQSFSLAIIFSAGDGAKSVLVAQTDRAGNKATVSLNLMKGTVLLDGVALYTNTCAACHGPIATSTKIGRTAEQIVAARGSIPLMLSSSAVQALTSVQINAIAVALAPKLLTTKFQCLNPAERGLSAKSMQRLQKYQLVNTLRTLVGSDVVADAQIQTQIESLSAEAGRTTMIDNSPIPSSGQPLAMLNIAARIVSLIEKSTVLRSRIFGTCSGSSPVVDSCATAFISTFGSQVYRRPLMSTESNSLLAQFKASGGVEGLNRVMMRLLLSPSMVFHVELGGAIQGDRVRLTDYEIASRISYRIIGTLPDSALMLAASRGELQSLSSVRTHARRLLVSDAQGKAQLRDFFRLYTASDSVPKPFVAAGAINGIDTSGLDIEMSQEIVDFVDHVVWSKEGSIKDLMTSREVFPRSSRMAKILEAPQVSGATPSLTTLAHAGLLLRPGLLSAPSAHTNTFPRAAQVRVGYLCETFGSPDTSGAADREAALGDLSGLSNRDHLTILTDSPKCLGCHSSLNPVGFLLEGYDQLGMLRSVESVFDSSGAVVKTHPINTSVGRTYLMDTNGNEIMGLDNAVGLGNAISSGSLVRACFSQRVFEYQRSRSYQSTDSCALSDVEAGTGSVLDTWTTGVANEDIFWKAKGN